jgi:hypothetical protein
VRHTIEFRQGGKPDAVITTHGTATPDGLNAYLTDLAADPRWKQGMTLLIDHRALDWSDITTADLRARAHRVATMPEAAHPTHVALVVGETVAFGLMRMFSTFVDDHIERGVFYDIAEAYAWLAAKTQPALSQ